MFLSFYLSSTKSRACHAKATGRGAETKGDMCECVACVCVWLGCMCVCECEVCVGCVCVSDVCASEWVRACVRACVRGWVGGREGGREGERDGGSEWVSDVCVCAWTIWKDVKLLTSQGACGHHANACQRSYAWWWKPGLITLVYLLYHFNVFSNGTWLTQEPPCRFQTNCFLFSFARFSQSEFLPTLSDGTVASSKDVERIPLHCLSRLVIHYFLSGLIGVFFARPMHSTSGIR